MTTETKNYVSGTKRTYFTRIPPENLCDDPGRIGEVKVFLEGYGIASRMLRIARVEENSLASDREEGLIYYGTVGGDKEYWLLRLRRVREFIETLENKPAKMLLYYHYIRGLTVERAAEELDISRRNAFRLKKKALALAAAVYPAWCDAQAS